MSISSKNSTSTPLNDEATFTGQTEDISQWTGIFVSCKTDQNCLVYVDHSSNGSDWDFTDILPVTASTAMFQSIESKCKYFRVRCYNNSGSNQTYLRLQVILRSVETNVSLDSDSQVVATMNHSDSSVVVYGQLSGTDYPLLTDNTGKLQVNVTSLTASDVDIRALTSADEVTTYPKGGEVWPVSGTVAVSSMPTTSVIMLNTTESYRNLDVGTTSSQIGSYTNVNRVCSIHAFNNSASKKYVKLYAGASADETDTPLMTLTVKSQDELVMNFSQPLEVGDSLCVRATTGLLDNDTGTPATNDVVLHMLYAGN